MFGFKFIKFQPTDYVIQYRKGKLVREGGGLAFFYFAPMSSLVRIPLASVDVPFIFEEVTADFQQVTVQGQVSYRVAEPKRLAQLMNFALTSNGLEYASEDPNKLAQRLINLAQVLTNAALKTLTLKQALVGSEQLVKVVNTGLKDASSVATLGLEILGFSILAIRPTPETARAMEAEAREQILREADQAVYSRRNAAVEQERTIKENELNTEIAVENKKRQIRETQMEAEKSVQLKKRELREAEMSAKIAIEAKNKEFVVLSTENSRLESEAKGYAISTMMKSIANTDPKVVQALSSLSMAPNQIVALAFKELAEGAERIGHLNVSPDLLRELMSSSAEK